ncbi:MAG: hypothetical protein B7X67_28065 [Rhizobiales bacterium 39-66-18]|nr:MAG: hypothetical protein B7X67_28065 [Rhizobiales bacterium 39-66-18]
MSKAKMPERKSSRRTLVLAFTLGIACTLGANALMSTARANQPFMDAALASLRAARARHRDRAIELVDGAINQVELGIAFAAGR